MPGVVRVEMANTLCSYQHVEIEGGHFVFKDPLFTSATEVIPVGFWNTVRQLWFAVDDGNYEPVKQFLAQWGDLIEEHDPQDRTAPDITPGIFGGHWGLPISTVKIALEWFGTLTALWENTCNGKLPFARDTLGAPANAEPWAAHIPRHGFVPFLSVFDPPYDSRRKVYALPADDDTLALMVLRFVATEMANRAGRVPLAPIMASKAVTATWYFQPRDWMDAAIVSFFIEKVTVDRLCKCGCGLPAAARSDYFDRRHAERQKKRQQREVSPQARQQVVDYLYKQKRYGKLSEEEYSFSKRAVSRWVNADNPDLARLMRKDPGRLMAKVAASMQKKWPERDFSFILKGFGSRSRKASRENPHPRQE